MPDIQVLLATVDVATLACLLTHHEAAVSGAAAAALAQLASRSYGLREVIASSGAIPELVGSGTLMTFRWKQNKVENFRG